MGSFFGKDNGSLGPKGRELREDQIAFADKVAGVTEEDYTVSRRDMQAREPQTLENKTLSQEAIDVGLTTNLKAVDDDRANENKLLEKTE